MSVESFHRVDLSDKQSAFVGLLARPLVAPWVDPTLFQLVTRHQHDLQKWAGRLGYHLVRIDQCYRLRRVPVGGEVALPAGIAEPRRPYVLALVTAACLEDHRDDSVTLQEISDAVRQFTAVTGVASYDPNHRPHRVALHRAVTLLAAHGVLEQRTRRADLLDAWERSGEGIGAGYVLHRDALVLLVDTRDAELALGQPSDAPDSRSARLLRTLVETQALYPALLDDSHRAHLTSQRHRLVDQVSEMTGGHIEVRSDAWVLILPSDKGLDADLVADFPAPTAVDWVALAMLDAVARDAAPDAATGFLRCDRAVVDRLAEQLHAARGLQLTQQLRESAEQVRGAAEDRLRRIGLLEVSDGAWELSPAAGRFRDADLRVGDAPASAHPTATMDATLFEEGP